MGTIKIHSPSYGLLAETRAAKPLSNVALTEGVPNASKWSAHMFRISLISQDPVYKKRTHLGGRFLPLEKFPK